jgi:hypothetical protein
MAAQHAENKGLEPPEGGALGRGLLMAPSVRLHGSVRHVAKADKACGRTNRDYKTLVK